MMVLDAFADGSSAERILSRLRSGSNRFGEVLECVVTTADPDGCLASLDRWIRATGEPAGRIELLADNAAFCHRLCFLLGASPAIGDVLVQNPELAMLLSDADALSYEDTVDQLMDEGRALLNGAISFTHGLDRIRYLKQRHLVKLVWGDLSGDMEPRVVWRWISDLADAVLQLTADIVWGEMAGGAELPVAVIAMGKHGSGELNYSSDIDLIFVCNDNADVELLGTFCSKYTRALEGKMGRGSLYRIDLRLRPLGAAGPIVQSVTSCLKYYKAYCEPWEIMALARARVCAGNRSIGSAFLSSVSSEVYKSERSEVFLEGLVEAKQRYEATITQRGERESNVKLGVGGIRDIEFFVQLHQLILGTDLVALQGASTIEALRQLGAADQISIRQAKALDEAYVLFRQLEHRIQLRNDLQTHLIPKEQAERNILAHLLGRNDWDELGAELRRRRAEVRTILENKVPQLAQPIDRAEADDFRALGFASGSEEARHLRRILEQAPDADGLRRSLTENSDARSRVKLLVQRAPRIVPEIAYHHELLDMAFSDEIEHSEADEHDIAEMFATRFGSSGLVASASLPALLRREFACTCLKFAHNGSVERTSRRLGAIADNAMLLLLDELGGEGIDIVALGRLGGGELCLPSDWDVMMLVRDDGTHQRSEKIGEEWMREVRRIHGASGYMPVDARLRPEGSQGLVVRTCMGLRHYGETAMETWERLALTRARSIRGWSDTEEAVTEVVGSKPWGWDEESEILAMRRRIHTERLRPWEVRRDVKLGEGCLMDAEWLCSILRLRHPELPKLSNHTVTALHDLAESGLIGTVEARELMAACELFSKIRNTLYLLDFDSDSVLPENPEKLDRLATSLEMGTGNDLLSHVECKRGAVLSVFQELVLRD